MAMSQPQHTPDPASSRTIRHDGITPQRQADFLTTLAATGSVSQAAAAAGVSRTALYRLRNSAEGAAFRGRWAEALREAVAVLADAAFDRALNGVSEPVWYKGEQIGERVRHDNRLLMFLLRSHDPATYAPPPRPSGITPVLVSTLSTSQAGPEQAAREEAAPEDDMDDATFRAELRQLRSSPEIPRHLSKRNARRLAAKGRLPAAHPT
jgi:hypothetical protein